MTITETTLGPESTVFLRFQLFCIFNPLEHGCHLNKKQHLLKYCRFHMRMVSYETGPRCAELLYPLQTGSFLWIACDIH